MIPFLLVKVFSTELIQTVSVNMKEVIQQWWNKDISPWIQHSFYSFKNSSAPYICLTFSTIYFCRNHLPKAAQLTAVYVLQDKGTDCGNRFRYTEMYLHKGRIGPVFLGLFTVFCAFSQLFKKLARWPIMIRKAVICHYCCSNHLYKVTFVSNFS